MVKVLLFVLPANVLSSLQLIMHGKVIVWQSTRTVAFCHKSGLLLSCRLSCSLSLQLLQRAKHGHAAARPTPDVGQGAALLEGTPRLAHAYVGGRGHRQASCAHALHVPRESLQWGRGGMRIRKQQILITRNRRHVADSSLAVCSLGAVSSTVRHCARVPACPAAGLYLALGCSISARLEPPRLPVSRLLAN